MSGMDPSAFGLQPLVGVIGFLHSAAGRAGGTSVTFILFSSLGGVPMSRRPLPAEIVPLLIRVSIAGWLGSRLGSGLLSLRVLERRGRAAGAPMVIAEWARILVNGAGKARRCGSDAGLHQVVRRYTGAGDIRPLDVSRHR
ncbi:hypothetical protein KBY66_00925 [Synechococcus sp. Tobar12-5m-g]|uniref:hypothetical protein n=1 Tax=unclassified Synechococcus TaxID=2626047 RepID=UPI0020CD3FB1|nr:MULTISPECIES: hypothetical protein [unclassified Synechococcus]MCP9771198.1 hypothetical protein [Synechococcus sp. Tobar12-5m-g]MCP9872138.1 hypothetical protein [Synechococcus sp. Cruz CV-v-12]